MALHATPRTFGKDPNDLHELHVSEDFDLKVREERTEGNTAEYLLAGGVSVKYRRISLLDKVKVNRS